MLTVYIPLQHRHGHRRGPPGALRRSSVEQDDRDGWTRREASPHRRRRERRPSSYPVGARRAHHMRELVLRVRARHRRSAVRAEAVSSGVVVVLGPSQQGGIRPSAPRAPRWEAGVIHTEIRRTHRLRRRPRAPCSPSTPRQPKRASAAHNVRHRSGAGVTCQRRTSPVRRYLARGRSPLPSRSGWTHSDSATSGRCADSPVGRAAVPVDR